MRIPYAKSACFLASALTVTGSARAWDQGNYVAPSGAGTFSLAPSQDQPAGSGTVVRESTTVTSTTTSTGMMGITGPINLRNSAAPPPGFIELKNVFGWSTMRNNGDDDFSYALQFEWGMVENHQLLVHLDSLQLGDGRVDGNGDVTIGWHWELWKQDGALPGMAVRNFVRIPTGDGSEGVDYELRGLMSWEVSDNSRINLNPWLRCVNGENEARVYINDNDDEVTEDPRHFRWGITAGMDYDLSSDFKLIWDYVYYTSVTQGHRDNHALEVGFDWHFADNQSFNMVAQGSLDGDNNDNPSFGATFSYVIEFGG